MRHLRIILIAHDSKKADLVEWAQFNSGTLSRHDLIATAATGEAVRETLGLAVARWKSCANAPRWRRRSTRTRCGSSRCSPTS